MSTLTAERLYALLPAIYRVRDEQQGGALHTRVFVENEPAVRFYRRHGFRVGNEVSDPLTGHPQYEMHSQPA